MKTTAGRLRTGLLFKPWVIAGVTVVIGLAVFAAFIMPWEQPDVVRTTHLPVVRFVPGFDREWGDTLVVSIDGNGVVWSGRERSRNLHDELESFFKRTRIEREEDGTRWVRIGEVLIRAHRESRWGDLLRVMATVADVGFPKVTVACRLGVFSPPERYLYVELADVDWTWEWDPEDPEPDEPARERIVIGSLDVGLAERAGERLATIRRAEREEGADRGPVFELAFPATASTQDVLSVLECYARPDGELSVVGLLR